jgi:hypothetical protein
VLIDPISNLTVAAGMIERRHIDPTAAKPDRRSSVFVTSRLTAGERRSAHGHGACLIRASAGDAVLDALERRLFEKGAHVVRLSRTVEPVEELLETGLLVIAPGDTAPDGYPYLDLAKIPLPRDPEAAAGEALERLRELGAWGERDQFTQGEGI